MNVSIKNIAILTLCFVAGAMFSGYITLHAMIDGYQQNQRFEGDYCDIIGDTAEMYLTYARNNVTKEQLVRLIDAHKGEYPDELIFAHHMIVDAAFFLPEHITIREFRLRWTLFCIEGF